LKGKKQKAGGDFMAAGLAVFIGFRALSGDCIGKKHFPRRVSK
jgi:hypothetical protein